MPAASGVSQSFVDASLEIAFRDHHRRKTRTMARVALVLGLVLYGVFGGLDYLLAPESTTSFWIIRYGVVCPMALVMIGVSLTEKGARWLPEMLVVLVTTAGLSIVIMTMIAPASVSQAYYVGLILVIFFGCTVAQLRFPMALGVGLVVIAAYEVAAVPELDPALLINDNFFLVTALVIGLLACWERERLLRRDFLQIREIEAQRRSMVDANARLESEASTDPLTGLSNRRHLQVRIRDAAALGRRYGVPSSLVLVDLDRFKRVNDNLGHPAGDRLLQAAAHVLEEVVRETDHVFRYGGDEFIVLMSGTDLEAATEAAGRIDAGLCALFAQEPWQPLDLGVSLGVNLVQPEVPPLASLEVVDRKLYANKGQASRS